MKDLTQGSIPKNLLNMVLPIATLILQSWAILLLRKGQFSLGLNFSKTDLKQT